MRRRPLFRHGFFDNVLRALGIAYLVRLLFDWGGGGGSPLGLLLVIGFVWWLVTRRRRRRAGVLVGLPPAAPTATTWDETERRRPMGLTLTRA